MTRLFMKQTERIKLCASYDQAVHEMGEKLMAESSIGASDIRSRLDQLTQSWDELKDMATNRLDSVCCTARSA